MVTVDGWICRSCWKPNRNADRRCYHCKTERTADERTVESRRRELAEKRDRFERRQDSTAGVMGVLPATIFRWYARILTVGGVLFILAIPLALMGPPARPMLGTVVLAGFGLGSLAIAAGFRWASGAMRIANPWGFAVGLVASLFVVGSSFWFMANLPAGVGNAPLTRLVVIVAFSLSAVLALVGLLYSLRDDQRSL